jgi:hypothetical protein
MFEDNTDARQPPKQPRGWFITCPVCRQDWKVCRSDLTDDSWQMCPSCLDSRLADERERTK